MQATEIPYSVLLNATQRANKSGEDQRIYRAYNSWCIRSASSDYDGIHIAYVKPDQLRHLMP